jgi:nitroreductase
VIQETPAEAWRLRYGTEPPEALPDLGKLLGHRSVRSYTGEPIAEATISALIAAAQSAATSSNLQLWSVISVQEPALRETLAKLCGDQQQIRDCAWFLTFFADHYRVRKAAHAVGELADGLDYVEFYTMAVIDAALAAERLVCAAEAMGIGICYIGGLRNQPAGVAEALKLPQGLFGVFGLCLGWPSEPLTAAIKPRLAQDEIWFQERYDENVEVGEYDERMRAFYLAEKMRGEITWSMRSGRRVGPSQLTGRHVLKGWLEEHGFNHR